MSKKHPKHLVSLGGKKLRDLPPYVEKLLLPFINSAEIWLGHLIAIIYNLLAVIASRVFRIVTFLVARIAIWKDKYEWSRHLAHKLDYPIAQLKIAHQELIEAKQNIFGEDAVTVFSSVDKSVELWDYIKGSIGVARRAGMVVFFIFVLWAGLAPLDSAVIGEGMIVSSTNNKVVQHQSGGTISRIMVRDGQQVHKGEVLMLLEDDAVRASLKAAHTQLVINTARLIRLNAEKESVEKLMAAERPFLLSQLPLGDGNSVPRLDISTLDVKLPDPDPQEVAFDSPVLTPTSDEIRKIIEAQQDSYQSRLSSLITTIRIKHQEIIQLSYQLATIETQFKTTKTHLDSVLEETNNIQHLVRKGFSTKQVLWEKQRTVSSLRGDLQKCLHESSKFLEGIGSSKLDISNKMTDFLRGVNEELTQTQIYIGQTREEVNKYQYLVEHTEIKSPEEGAVTNMLYHTIGGVISPGVNVMEIVPKDDKLIVEAKISYRDISSLHVGMLAHVQLDAYKSKLVPRLDGKVLHISADAVRDQRGMMRPDIQGIPYYVVKIEIDEQQIKRLNYPVKLLPGMPATVFIVRGTRTLGQYLLSPIVDSFHRAFKEA